MTNTLELLELTKNNVNINDALNNVDEFIGILDQKYSEKENQETCDNSAAQSIAIWRLKHLKNFVNFL